MLLTNQDLQAIADLIDERLDKKLDEKLDAKLDEKLAPINSRLDKLESELSAVKSNQIDMRRELKAVDAKISATYELALDAWGTSTENRHLIEQAN